MTANTKRIQFGTNLIVTDEGSGKIRVDKYAPAGVSWTDVGVLCTPGVPIVPAYVIPGAGLQYWYRLGEAKPWPTGPVGSPAQNVANFMLDSSGNNRHATAVNSVYAGGPYNVILPTGDPNLPQTGVVGALAPGNADDGGIYFKWYESTSQYYACFLSCGGLMEPNLRSGAGAIGTASTWAAWMAFMPQTGPGSGIYSLASTWARQFGVGNYGCKAGFNLADGSINYHVGSLNVTNEFDFSTVGTKSGEWHHFATQVIRLATNSYRRRIYFDAVKVFELTDTLVNIGSGCENQAGLTLGGGNSNDIWSVHGGGKLDEVAYWTSELSQAQITDIYHARVVNAGDTWV